MSRFEEEIHAITGELPQVPIGKPGVVGVLEESHLLPPSPEGIIGVAIGAGGAGSRSEIGISLLATAARDQLAEISEIWVNTANVPQTVEVIVGDLAGFTQVVHSCSDLRLGRTDLFIGTQNVAAATASIRPIFPSVVTGVANVYVPVPGRIFLARAGGTVNQSTVIFRATADQQVIRLIARYRIRVKRSL